MKKIVLSLGTLLMATLLMANRPSEVPSKIEQLRSKSWYLTLAGEWKHYLQEHTSQEDSWLQYLVSSKYAGATATEISDIKAEIDARFAKSFSSHYAAFVQHGWNDEGVLSLKSALKVDQSKRISLEDQLVLAELESMNRAQQSIRLFNSGMIHSSTLNYCYNVLMSVAEEGLLITDGVHLTVPIWVLQDVMNVRKDVTILNLELAGGQPDYLERTLAAKGLNGSAGDLLQGLAGEKVYYALTLPRELLNANEENLFIVGLASTSGANDFDHFETLRENIENKFLMDYLTVDFNGEPKAATGQVLATNYIVPLLLLKEFYDDLNDDKRSGELKTQILALAKDTNMQDRVMSILKETEKPVSYKKTELDLKALERNMVPIKGNLYASQYELSNREFWFFMEYLRNNKYTEIYDQAIADLSKFEGLDRTLMGHYLYSPVNFQALKAKRRGGDYLDYPVLEITYETAKVYCEWLTAQYNVQEKRKYQQVKFRLPSKDEWIMSALGYSDFQSWKLNENKIRAKAKEGKAEISTYDLSEHSISYPWGLNAWDLRSKVTNYFDCYLANVRADEEITCPAGMKGDGFTFTSPVGTYFKNQLGLYDVIGNVAEMVNEEGVAMGGSWDDVSDECTINSVQSYEDSNIKVGMRLFMEIIEQ